MTRFELVVIRRIREIHNVAVDGAFVSSDAEVVAEQVDEVRCGWCGDHESVEELGETGAI